MTAASDAPAPGRREVLRWFGATGMVSSVAVLSGCRLRWEDNAPDLPVLQRKSIPDEALLISVLRRAELLRALASGPAGLAPRFAEHSALLRSILHTRGVPDQVIDGPAATSSAPSAPQSAVPPTDLLARACADLSPVLAAISTAVAHRPVFVAIAAHDGATAVGLGVAPAWPSSSALPGTVAQRLVEPTRAAIAAAQTAAARLAPDQRTAVLATLAVLQRRERGLAAATPVSDAGAATYPLPAGDPTTMVRSALSEVVALGLVPLPDLTPGSPAAIELARLQAEAVRLAATHGGVPEPFPGLRR